MLRRLEEGEPQRIEESLWRALETTNEGTEKGMLRSVLVACYLIMTLPSQQAVLRSREGSRKWVLFLTTDVVSRHLS